MEMWLRPRARAWDPVVSARPRSMETSSKVLCSHPSGVAPGTAPGGNTTWTWRPSGASVSGVLGVREDVQANPPHFRVCSHPRPGPGLRSSCQAPHLKTVTFGCVRTHRNTQNYIEQAWKSQLGFQPGHRPGGTWTCSLVFCSSTLAAQSSSMASVTYAVLRPRQYQKQFGLRGLSAQLRSPESDPTSCERLLLQAVGAGGGGSQSFTLSSRTNSLVESESGTVVVKDVRAVIVALLS